MKKYYLFITIVMILIILVTGCGGGKTVDNQKTGEEVVDYVENDNSQDNDGIMNASQEGPEFTLKLKVLSEREAVFMIEGFLMLEEILAPYPKRTIEDGAPFLSFLIDFDRYQISVNSIHEIGHQNHMWGLGVFQKKEDGTMEYVEAAQSFVFTLEGNVLSIEMNISKEEINFHQIEELQFKVISHAGFLITDRSISVRDILDEGSQTTTSRVFPSEVYEAGFKHAEGDSQYFYPMTEDYLLAKINREPDNGDRMEYLLVFFDDFGSVKGMLKRSEMIMGQKSGPNGVETVYADKENMESNKNDMISHGLNDADVTGYIENSITFVDHYYYTYLSHQDSDNENWYTFGYNELEPYLCTKEVILKKNELGWGKSSLLDVKETAVPIYFSKKELTKEQRMAPHYCELSDFELFTYASPLSEDYQITATKVGEEIVLYINYYNSRGETIGAERILKKGVYPDWSLQKVHPDNPNIIIHSFSENAVEGETVSTELILPKATVLACP